jgi:NIMA (never in mitosis gene a)-related kinase
MLTLQHAFDANSMKGLVFKILKGTYPPISSHYSENTNQLLAEMLTKDPQKRPSIKKILDKEFLNSRISHLFSKTVAQ